MQERASTNPRGTWGWGQTLGLPWPQSVLLVVDLSLVLISLLQAVDIPLALVSLLLALDLVSLPSCRPRLLPVLAPLSLGQSSTCPGLGPGRASVDPGLLTFLSAQILPF